METNDNIDLNSLLPDEILVQIFECYDYKVLKNMSLVCSRWTELIGNTTRIYQKFPLVINSDNIDQMAKSKVKQMRKYKPNHVVAQNLKYSEIAGKPKMIDYFAGAKVVHFKDMAMSHIRDILDICKQVGKVMIDSPTVLPEDQAAGDNNEMRVKRMRLDPVKIDLSLYLRRVATEGDEFDDLLQILDELNIQLKTLSLSCGYGTSYSYLVELLHDVGARHPGCVLTGLDLNNLQMTAADYIDLVRKFDDADNVKLNHFTMPYGEKMKETDLIQLLACQREIKNLKIKDEHTELLTTYAIDNLPHLERLSVNDRREGKGIPFINAINDLKWPNLRDLDFSPGGEFNLLFLNFLPNLESFQTSCCRVTIPPLQGPLKALKKLYISESKLSGSSLQQIFKNMPNLTHFSIQMIEGVTNEMILGEGEDYSIGSLTNLEELTLDGDFLRSKEVRAVMKFPYLTQLCLCIKSKKWDIPMCNRDMHKLGVQCPNLQSVTETAEDDCLWSRDAKTRRFENCNDGSSSDEISHSSNSDLRSEDCDCESDDCECVSMAGAWRDIQPRYGAGSNPTDMVNRCAQQ